MADAAVAAPAAPVQATPTQSTQPPAAAGAAAVTSKPKAPPKPPVEGTPEESEESKAKGERLTAAERAAISKAAWADKALADERAAAKKAREEAAAIKAEREEEKRLAKENREEWLRRQGIDPDEYARERLEAKLKEQGMSEAERNAAKEKARADAAEKREKEAQAKAREQVVAQHTQAIQQRMVADLSGAAEKVGLPKTADGFAALHEVTAEYVELGLPWNPERIAQEAKSKLDAAGVSLREQAATGMSDEDFEAWAGPAVLERARKLLVAKYRKGKTTFGQPAAAPPAPPVQAPSSYLTPAEADAQMRALRAKGGR